MPCRGLARALPAVLARSERDATLLLAHLTEAERERLRVAALSPARCQRVLPVVLPAPTVSRILALIGCRAGGRLLKHIGRARAAVPAPY